MFLTDSHAHLEFLGNLENSLVNAKSNGIAKIITIGTSIGASEKCIGIAEKFSSSDLEIFATTGIHAEDGKKDLERYGQNYLEKLKDVALSSKRVVGIGECGFDIRESTDKGEIDFQRDLFENQIKLAQELSLPLVIHCRNAWEETFELIKKYYNKTKSHPQLCSGSARIWNKSAVTKKVSSRLRSNNSASYLRGVFHSFTGGIEEMEKAIELGFYVSFSGIVTFKNAGEIAQAAKKIPLERMLVETDSPFLSPEPLRGKKNEPENVRITAQFLAQLRNQSQKLLIEATTRNAQELFYI